MAIFKVTNDIRTIAMKFYTKDDVKKIEALMFKAGEILANVKNDGSYQAISGCKISFFLLFFFSYDN